MASITNIVFDMGGVLMDWDPVKISLLLCPDPDDAALLRKAVFDSREWGFDARVTNIDLKDLSSNMRTFAMLTALEAVRNLMYRNWERGVTTWLYIDEVQSLFDHPAIVSYFSKFWAEGRKFNLVCTGITQNSVYMLAHEEARNMVLNSDFILLHKQSPLDRKAWVDLLGLSDEEATYIDESVRPGEGLLVIGLFLGFRYRIEGQGKVAETVNDAMGKAADAAESVKESIA